MMTTRLNNNNHHDVAHSGATKSSTRAESRAPAPKLDSTKSAAVRNRGQQITRNRAEKGEEVADFLLPDRDGLAAMAIEEREVTGVAGAGFRHRQRDLDAEAPPRPRRPEASPYQGTRPKSYILENMVSWATNARRLHPELHALGDNGDKALRLAVSHYLKRQVSKHKVHPAAVDLEGGNTMPLWALFDSNMRVIITPGPTDDPSRSDGWEGIRNWPRQGPTPEMLGALSVKLEASNTEYWRIRHQSESLAATAAMVKTLGLTDEHLVAIGCEERRAIKRQQKQNDEKDKYEKLLERVQESEALARAAKQAVEDWQEDWQRTSDLNGSSGEATNSDDTSRPTVFYRAGQSPLEQSAHAALHIDGRRSTIDLTCGCIKSAPVTVEVLADRKSVV